MKKITTLVLIFTTGRIFAQLPEDALRLSWMAPSGTARQQAIGGAMGSLGGEISAAYVNPAGLGLFRTSELVLSPGFRFASNTADYRGSSHSGSLSSNFNLGTSGVVFGMSGYNGASSSFTIAVNRTASFNNDISYSGQNNFSSFAEQYAEEFASSGLSIDAALNGGGVSYGSRMALYTYLIDTASSGGNINVIAQPEKVLAAGGILNQQYRSSTRGGITEIALSFAGTSNNKLYFGGTLGIPIVNYSRDLTISESDASGNTNNDFASATYKENFTSKGIGFNIKLGLIYRTENSWRLGLAVHSPSFYSLTDNINATMTANTENYQIPPKPSPETTISSGELDAQSGFDASEAKYGLTSPWHFIGSASYIFGESSDVKSQKGFVTGDVEYVTTASTRFTSTDNYTDNSYFDGVNSAVKASYKGALNLRVGGEMKFNTLAARAGFAYYGNPYQDTELKANKMLVSGGVGYRNKGVFVDLTYVQNISKDVNFPYRLAGKANTFATLNETGGTVLVTVGFKL